uniref:DOMON domain-containing protein n=1 Tax=Panagrellus redivivus TaxID=6233 RepID=A0A7E4UZB9_PANRE
MQGRDPETDRSGRYIAVGFSDDPWMGNDTVFECVVDGSSGSDVFVSVNVGRMNKRLIGASEGLLSAKGATVLDGQVICRFEVDLDGIKEVESDSERNHEFDSSSLSNKYLLYASGPLSKSGTKLPHPLDHGSDFFPMVTPEKVDLNTYTVIH